MKKPVTIRIILLKIWFVPFVLVISQNCSKENTSVAGCMIGIPADTYAYPLTPSSPAWAGLSPAEIWQMDQLPDTVTGQISTAGLLETCLTFPYYGDIGLTYYHQDAFDHMYDHFNGIRELMERADAPWTIFERYRMMSPLCEKYNYSSFTGRGNSVSMSFIDFYLFFRLFKYSTGVITGISESLKSFPFLVIKILQSIFNAQ